jgi:hypothetical protein
MKLAVVFAVYLAFSAFMIFGLVKAVAGNLWWLVAALVIFFFGFIRFGCKAH